MVGTLALSGAVLNKAGANCAAAIKTEAKLVEFINQAEGFICAATRKNWIDAYAALNADVKFILEEITSNLAAIYAIQYDMTDFNSRAEAELMCTILYQRALDGIKLIQDQKVEKFIVDGV